MDIGTGFWLKMVGAIIGIGILMVIAVILLGDLWARFGAIGALLVVFGILAAITYRSDRKRQRRYEELDDEA